MHSAFFGSSCAASPRLRLADAAPLYLHHPLMLDEAGNRLAKRCDSLSIAALRQQGLTAAEALAMTDAAMPDRPETGISKA